MNWSLIEERLLAVNKNMEYEKHKNKTIELGRKIMNALGPDKSLFLEYETCACLAKSIKLKSAYQLGLEDGSSRAQQNAQQSIAIHNINI